jgi:preprotein translocase subunit SecE
MMNFWEELRRRKYLREEQFVLLVYMTLIILNWLIDYAIETIISNMSVL